MPSQLPRAGERRPQRCALGLRRYRTNTTALLTVELLVAVNATADGVAVPIAEGVAGAALSCPGCAAFAPVPAGPLPPGLSAAQWPRARVIGVRLTVAKRSREGLAKIAVGALGLALRL
jgi:hypothetical protein